MADSQNDVEEEGRKALEDLSGSLERLDFTQEKEKEVREKELKARRAIKKKGKNTETAGEPESEEPTPEEAEKVREGKKARIAQIMSRGILNDRLQSVYNAAVPDDRRGKFIRDDPGDIVRYSNLGFTFDYVEGATGMHGTPDDRIRVGDVVLMTISLEDRAILHEVRLDGIKKKLGASRIEYEGLVASALERGQGVPGFDEGHTIVQETTPEKERSA